MKKLRLATVFSGIGAVEQALEKNKVKYDIVFACDNGERELPLTPEEIKEKINGRPQDEVNAYVKKLYDETGKKNYVKQSYFANYKIDEKNWYEDIRFLDGKQYKDKVDILVGGSPCQSFSIIGKKAGLEDTRGTLFYDYARLIKETQPKVFIFENVPGMLVHDDGNTWKVISSVFNSLGYKIFKQILNSKDYGIPQDRKRLFVVGFRDGNPDFQFPESIPLNKTFFDFLDTDVDAKHYLGKKGFEFVTNPFYSNRARVNPTIIQTEKANQQFNWNGDFFFQPIEAVRQRPDIMARAYVGTWKGQIGVIRQLTYRECLRFMGFQEKFKIVVPNVPAYRQSGNSIVVNVLQALLNSINEARPIYENN